jgi:steroid delta-isomerase-like uncharacterized protein
MRRMSTITTHTNESAVAACFKCGVARDYEGLKDLVTPDYVLHPEEARGPDELAQVIQGYHEALSDISVDVEHQFSAGDWVATRVTLRGRHTGDFAGVPPTGRDLEVTGLTISRCREGRIEEEWELFDLGGALQQLGA